MFAAFIVQVVVCILILRWLSGKKTGEPYSRKMIIKFLGFGAVAVVVCLFISFLLPIKRDSFFDLNPILAGFLTALITAAAFEELIKYLLFRLVLIKNEKVISWLDAIIAAVIVGIGFTLLEDAEFAVTSGTNILRAIIPAHLLFQGIMGYYYGKARVKKSIYDALSLAVPILVHTFFDMFLIALMAILGDAGSLTGLTPEELIELPGWNYVLPALIGAFTAIIVVFVALILMFRKIGVWSKKGGKEETLYGVQKTEKSYRRGE